MRVRHQQFQGQPLQVDGHAVARAVRSKTMHNILIVASRKRRETSSKILDHL
jgi:hypothetical protein